MKKAIEHLEKVKAIEEHTVYFFGSDFDAAKDFAREYGGIFCSPEHDTYNVRVETVIYERRTQ